MTDHDALMAACRKELHAAMPFDVAADWLDEHEEPIAAYMFRLQAAWLRLDLIVEKGPKIQGIQALESFLGYTLKGRITGKVASKPEHPNPETWRGSPKGMDRVPRRLPVTFSVEQVPEPFLALQRTIRTWPRVRDVQVFRVDVMTGGLYHRVGPIYVRQFEIGDRELAMLRSDAEVEDVLRAAARRMLEEFRRQIPDAPPA